MEREVTDLFFRVCAKEKEAYLLSHNNVIGKGNTNDYSYNPYMIEMNEDRLMNFLNLLDVEQEKDIYFTDLFHTKDGSTWTEFYQKLDFLASMLNAAGLLEYEEEPVYDPYRSGNPKIKIIQKDKRTI